MSPLLETAIVWFFVSPLVSSFSDNVGLPFKVFLTNLEDVKLIQHFIHDGLIRGLPDHLIINSSVTGEALNQDTLGKVNVSGKVEALPHNFGLTKVRRSVLAINQKSSDIFKSYPRFDEIQRFLTSLASSFQSIVSLETIGNSYESRQLKVIKIGSPTRNNSNKPIVWIDAGIHAREWIAPITSIYVANRLIRDYDSDPITKALVDTFDWRILPVANPDGYEYSHTTDRLWRKTRSRNGTNPSCVGADANRNFDFHWMESGSSSNPCSEIYAGSKPFSEPESVAIATYLMKYQRRVKLYLSLHAYAQQWLYPWGYAAKLADRNDDLQKKASIAAAAISSKYGTKYDIGPSGIALYPASGGSDDWALGVAKIPYSYTVELRPDSESPFGFILPPDQIVPVGEETLLGIKRIAQEIGKELIKTKRNRGSRLRG